MTARTLRAKLEQGRGAAGGVEGLISRVDSPVDSPLVILLHVPDGGLTFELIGVLLSRVLETGF